MITQLRRLAPLGFALAIIAAAGPAAAHKGHHHGASPPTAAASQTAPSAAEASAAPQMEMSWPTSVDQGMAMDEKPRPTTFLGRLVAWLGAWHPAIIHFPVALVLTVAFLEAAGAVRRKPLYTAGNKIILALAMIGALAAAPLGWADAGLPSAKDDWTLTAHRWIGTALPFLVLSLWFLKRPADEAAKQPGSRGYEALLAFSVVVILAQAYLGGEITHGHNHMAF